MRSANRTLNRIAVDQHGLVTRDQARANGVSARQLDARVAGGLLVVVHRGVYRLAGVPVTRDQLILGACLAGGPRATASHRSAAVLWGLRGVEVEDPEITVAGDARPLLRGVIVHRSSLGSTDVGLCDGIPTTRPARTLLDLASVDPEAVEGALNDALFRGLTTVGALQRLLDGCGTRGRAGATLVRELVAAYANGTEPTESALEDALLRLFRRHRLPEPRRQFRVTLPDGKRGRIDLAYPEQLLAIEADGGRWHSGPAAVRRDRHRDARLAAMGWAVLRYRWADLARGAEVAAEVRLCRARPVHSASS